MHPRWRSREPVPLPTCARVRARARARAPVCVRGRARIRESGINPGLLVVCAPPAVQIQNPTHTTQLIPTRPPAPPLAAPLVALASLPSLGVSCVPRSTERYGELSTGCIRKYALADFCRSIKSDRLPVRCRRLPGIPVNSHPSPEFYRSPRIRLTRHVG